MAASSAALRDQLIARMRLLLLLSEVLVVGDALLPLECAGIDAELQRRLVGRRAVPMQHVRLRQHRLARGQILDRVAELLPAAAPFLDEKNLASAVEMPVGARASLEADARHVHPGCLL